MEQNYCYKEVLVCTRYQYYNWVFFLICRLQQYQNANAEGGAQIQSKLAYLSSLE